MLKAVLRYPNIDAKKTTLSTLAWISVLIWSLPSCCLFIIDFTKRYFWCSQLGQKWEYGTPGMTFVLSFFYCAMMAYQSIFVEISIILGVFRATSSPLLTPLPLLWTFIYLFIISHCIIIKTKGSSFSGWFQRIWLVRSQAVVLCPVVVAPRPFYLRIISENNSLLMSRQLDLTWTIPIDSQIQTKILLILLIVVRPPKTDILPWLKLHLMKQSPCID